jgi:hypothetical protein
MTAWGRDKKIKKMKSKIHMKTESQLPVDPSTCQPIYPNQYLHVNTIFEVAHRHHLLTAWSDKHPAYQILSGPSGEGVDNYFTPEINSSASAAAPTDPSQNDWTTDNLLTQQYDGYNFAASRGLLGDGVPQAAGGALLATPDAANADRFSPRGRFPAGRKTGCRESDKRTKVVRPQANSFRHRRRFEKSNARQPSSQRPRAR